MAERRETIMRCLESARMRDDATLKKAYRKVAKKYHPDMNPGDKEAEKEVQRSFRGICCT